VNFWQRTVLNWCKYKQTSLRESQGARTLSGAPKARRGLSASAPSERLGLTRHSMTELLLCHPVRVSLPQPASDNALAKGIADPVDDGYGNNEHDHRTHELGVLKECHIFGEQKAHAPGSHQAKNAGMANVALKEQE
jgi:hypothetical protein